MAIKISKELKSFQVPNYVTEVTRPRPREEGMTEAPKHALKDLAAETLSALCVQFRAEVFAKAGKVDPQKK